MSAPRLEALFLAAADVEDAGSLADLEQACQSHPWSRAQFAATLCHPAHAGVLVLRGPGGLAGHCVVGWGGGEAEVQNLAVHPRARRRGLGRLLLRHALRLAARQGGREAFLEVRAGNRAARRLYEECGFREVGLRRGYYQDPPEDATVMRSGLHDVAEEY
ncbi:MAG TPA: ribosomal protein S18-alanine N-acetyltransferase [Vicinamibacteria bacterium]